MNLSDLEKLRFMLQPLKQLKDPELYRSKTYSIFVEFLLSTNIFGDNKKLKTFISENHSFIQFNSKYEIEMKDYLFKSRTNLVGRYIRKIQTAEINDIKTLIKVINDIAFFEATNPPKNNNAKSDENENYYDSLLEQFTRS